MFITSNSPYFIRYPLYTPLLSEKSILTLSKQRIIQKNLVHFQGFPDCLYNQDILLSQEYFGQYGHILKIALVSKEDKTQKKKTNSAYITYENEKEAAYCILAVDSIRINDHLVRAFFGTTKYCSHFLNNYKCFNEDKCMFLHSLANSTDIINENSKFNYNDHIQLAKKIIDSENKKNKAIIMNMTFKFKTVLPNIKNIYSKEEVNIMVNLLKDYTSNNIRHTRLNSNSSNNSTTNNSTNRSNNRTISRSPPKKDNNNDTQIIFNNNNNLSTFSNNSGNKKSKSRFFEIYEDNDNELYNKNVSNIVNGILKRKLFFNKFKNYKEISLSYLEKNYCINEYKKTEDEEIKASLENMF